MIVYAEAVQSSHGRHRSLWMDAYGRDPASGHIQVMWQ